MTIIRVVDFETTGFEPPAVVCEAATCDYTLGQPVDKSTFKSWLCGGFELMPPEVRSIHRITMAEIGDAKPFDQNEVLGPVDAYAAHNVEFELKFFTPDKPVICTYKSALRFWPDAPGHSNGTLFCWLEDRGLIKPMEGASEPAHRAGPDTYMTAHILDQLFAAGATGKQMVQWTREPRLLTKCPIGKFKGKPWSEVEDGFLGWMMRQPDMEADLKWNAGREIERRQGAAT